MTDPKELIARLRAASHDERLATGALYREAADYLQQASEQKPVATLHDDGWWTHPQGRNPLDQFSGKRQMDVYAAPVVPAAPAADMVMVPHDNKPPVTVHPMLDPTHICKDCGVAWRQCDDFTFNLRGEKACPACDNAPVGGQLIPITAPLNREIQRLRTMPADYVMVPRALIERIDTAMSAAEWANIPGRWREVHTEVRAMIAAADRERQ